MLGLDKLGPGSILVVLIAGGWLTAWAEWARVRVAVQACGCLVTLAGLWRSGIMVRLGPGPTCSPGRLKPGASGRCPPGPAEYVVPRPDGRAPEGGDRASGGSEVRPLELGLTSSSWAE
jgi:hypothetical protein